MYPISDETPTLSIPAIKRGDSWSGMQITAEMLTDDAPETWAPIVLTGAVIRVDFYLQGSERKALALITGAGITITDAELGEFKFDQIENVTLAPGVYESDLQITVSSKTVTYCNMVWPITNDKTK